MTRAFLEHLLALSLLAAALPLPAAADPKLPPLPPLNEPATDERLPGKFVWSDIFTSDVSGIRRFYSGVLGWDWRWISEQPGHLYGMFYDDGVAVAGVAQRAAPVEGRSYARWIHYFSAEDVAAVESGTLERGGRAWISRRAVANRGELAILSDPEGAPFGVLKSSSGDPPDYRAEVGEWIWIGLFTRDAGAASKFYTTLLGYDVRETDEHPEVLDLILVEGGHSRAGIAELSPDSENKPTWLGFVRVEDVSAALDKVRRLGGEVVWEPQDEALRGDLAVVTDPIGAPIGLLHWDFEEDDATKEAPQP